jgi:hypothetical protein
VLESGVLWEVSRRLIPSKLVTRLPAKTRYMYSKLAGCLGTLINCHATLHGRPEMKLDSTPLLFIAHIC